MSRPLRIGDRLLAARMIVIMAFLVLLYVSAALAAVAFLVHGDEWSTATVVVILVAVGGVISAGQRRGSRRRLLAELRAKEVRPDEEPELHGVLDRLCGLAGIAKPRVLVADTDLPNALAVGAELCVTRGLMARLAPAELEAVLAHELGHLVHRDGTVLEYAAAPGIVCGRYVRVGLFVLFAQAVYWLSTLLVLMLSRARELAADRAGAMLTGRPSDLAAALVKLSAAAPQIPRQDLRAVQPYQAMLCLEMPGAKRGRLSAHPPLDRRLHRLAAISAQLGRQG
jgi:heat shock protein HtpX